MTTAAHLATAPSRSRISSLGSESEGLTWNSHGAAVALSPLDAADRKEPIQLYYQVKSATDRPQLKTTIALYRVDDAKPSTEPALQVSYTDGVHEGLNEVAPSLDVSRLDKGSYRLEVRVEDAAGKVSASRVAMLYLN